MRVDATELAIRPERLRVEIEFDPTELKRIFEAAEDPDEILYFAVFSGEWDELDSVDRLARLLDIAQLVKATAPPPSLESSITLEPKGIPA